MSRLYGRVEDVKGIANYLIENYNKKYKKDRSPVEYDDVIDSLKCIITYLDKNIVSYINRSDINICWNRYIRSTVYSGAGDKENYIFFPTKEMKECYKIDYLYFIGDLLRRYRFDYLQDQYDIRCQFSDVLPLLMEYLYFKENNQEELFSAKTLYELRQYAPHYKRIYNKHERHPILCPDDYLLRNTLPYLASLSSVDATLQIIDKYKDNKDEIRYLIYDLVNNENHNREEIINSRNIETYGFKRLRKEIDLRK